MAKIAETPLMTQYIEMKKKHPDAVLLFRVGDFTKHSPEDAITASEILGIHTHRAMPTERRHMWSLPDSRIMHSIRISRNS